MFEENIVWGKQNDLKMLLRKEHVTRNSAVPVDDVTHKPRGTLNHNRSVFVLRVSE